MSGHAAYLNDARSLPESLRQGGSDQAMLRNDASMTAPMREQQLRSAPCQRTKRLTGRVWREVTLCFDDSHPNVAKFGQNRAA